MSQFRVVLLSACLLAPCSVHAQMAPAAGAAVQVVRPGDSQLACPALIAEIDGISQQIQVASERMQGNAERARSAATREAPSINPAQTLAGLAAGFIPGAGVALGVAQTAAAMGKAAGPSAPNAEMQAMAGDAATMMSLIPASQRFQHLSELARAKGC